MYEFRWNDWNRGKCEMHNVAPKEAEYVVNHARRPWPKRIDDRKRIVWGQTERGDYLQVIYLLERGYEVFVIHARPLRDNEKRQYRRRRR